MTTPTPPAASESPQEVEAAVQRVDAWLDTRYRRMETDLIAVEGGNDEFELRESDLEVLLSAAKHAALSARPAMEPSVQGLDAITEAELKELIPAFAAPYSISEWCRQKGVNRSHANEFLNGLRGPQSDLVKACGLRWALVIDNDPASSFALSARQPSAGPVAWRVKDFGDGWILCATEAQARAEAESAGNLVQPLYAGPPVSEAAGEVDLHGEPLWAAMEAYADESGEAVLGRPMQAAIRAYLIRAAPHAPATGAAATPSLGAGVTAAYWRCSNPRCVSWWCAKCDSPPTPSTDAAGETGGRVEGV